MNLLTLLVGQGSAPTDPGANPGLTTWRQISATYQGHNAPAGPATWSTQFVSKVEASGLRLAWSGDGGQSGPRAWSLRCWIEGVPLTVGGHPLITVPANTVVWTDDIPLSVQPGQHINAVVEAVQPGPPNGRSTTADQFGNFAEMCWPTAILGKTTPTEKALVVVGDSITTQGRWVNVQTVPTIQLGVPVTRWAGTEMTRYGGQAPAILNAGSHVVLQFGVNNIGNGDLSYLKSAARSCWDSHKAATTRPIWQTTPTPKLLTTTGDGCASSAGQTLGGWEPDRQALLAWLRDGAPSDTGVRAGQPGHPLAGIIDMAASVESPTEPGKWDWTKGDLGGDGTHPTDLGMVYMGNTLAAWLAAQP